MIIFLFSDKIRKIDISELANDPKKIHDLLDEIGFEPFFDKISQLLSKSFPDDTIEEDYNVNILTTMGYLEKYLPQEFYEIGDFKFPRFHMFHRGTKDDK